MSVSNQIIIVIFLITLHYPSNKSYAQQASTKDTIDSLVKMCKHDLQLEFNTNKKLIALFLDNGNSIKTYNCNDSVSLVLDFKSNEDTIFVKELYSLNKNLFYVNEKHILYSKNKIIDSLRDREFIIGYEAQYYVIDNFYAGGAMKYSYEFAGYEYSPEPITYVSKMIQINKEYLK